MSVLHCGHSFVAGFASGLGSANLMIRKMTNPMITKSTTAPIRCPYVIPFSTTFPVASVVRDSTIFASRQLPPGKATPKIGLMTSSTIDVTTFPIAALSGPSDGVPYQPRIFQFIGLDPAPIASFSVDWGDGSRQVIAGPSPAFVAHAFTATGMYTVTMTATDVNGNVSDPVSQTIAISVIEQQGTELAVGGTAGDDVLLVRKGGTKNTTEVFLNGASLGTFANPSLFLFYGGDGNDQTTIAGVQVPTLQDGGAGSRSRRSRADGEPNCWTPFRLRSASIRCTPSPRTAGCGRAATPFG